jgi:hypothetical protein
VAEWILGQVVEQLVEVVIHADAHHRGVREVAVLKVGAAGERCYKNCNLQRVVAVKLLRKICGTRGNRSTKMYHRNNLDRRYLQPA